MTALRDSRIIAGLLAIVVGPVLLYVLRYADTFVELYADLDSELDVLSQLMVGDGTGVVLAVALVGLLALTWRPIGPATASDDAVVVVRVGVVLSALGSFVAFEAAFAPVRALFEKIV